MPKTITAPICTIAEALPYDERLDFLTGLIDDLYPSRKRLAEDLGYTDHTGYSYLWAILAGTKTSAPRLLAVAKALDKRLQFLVTYGDRIQVKARRAADGIMPILGST